jgi:exosome complex component RRP41
MGKQEYVSPEGLRQDGRRPNELRVINGQMDIFPRADGSATLSFGNTKIIANVYGPQEVHN